MPDMRTSNSARKHRKANASKNNDVQAREHGETPHTGEGSPPTRTNFTVSPHHSVKAERKNRKVKSVYGGQSKPRSTSIFSPEECSSLRKALLLESRCLTGSIYPKKSEQRSFLKDFSSATDEEGSSGDSKRRHRRPSGTSNDVEHRGSFPRAEIPPSVVNFVLPLATPAILRGPRFRLSLPSVLECDEEQCSF